MVYLFSCVVCCYRPLSEDQPPTDQADPTSDFRSNEAVWAQTDSLPDPMRTLTEQTLKKLSKKYRRVIVESESKSSVIYFSGPDEGLFEVHSFPADPQYQGVTVFQSGMPVATLEAAEEGLLSEVDDAKTAVLTGGNLIDHFSFQEQADSALLGLRLFLGWRSVRVMRPEVSSLSPPSYLLTVPTDRNLMFLGLPKGAQLEIVLLRAGEPEVNASGKLELSYVPDEVRVCTVPFWDRQGYTELGWSNCLRSW